jgi:biopolymer transport protein ExbB
MSHSGIERILTGIVQLGTQWILWLLVGLSLVGLAIIVERTIYFVNSRGDVKGLIQDVKALMGKQRFQELRLRLAELRSPAASVASAALDGNHPEESNELMLGAAEQVRLDMERSLAFLSTVGSNAPFVGLLGTVIGIVRAFQELDRSGGALSDGLMSEIGEALIATAVGLLVALPAIAAFNVFRRIIQARMAETETIRHVVVAKLKAQEEHG